MTRKLILFTAGVVAMTVLGLGVAAAQGTKTIRTMGDEVLKPNVSVHATLRFSPGPLTVGPGDSVTWVGEDKSGAPHTVTLTRDPDELVKTFSDFLLGTCPACDAVIGAALGGHFPIAGPPVLELRTGDGFGDDGDSFLFGNGFPNSNTQTLTNVTSGETIYYFCAIHSWMQGTIEVKG
ncbi:MAG: cupredoxin domain-containing protein [Acidimicrobiia bacterium]